MRLHGRVIRRPWLFVAGAVLLVAGHGFLYQGLSTMTLPIAVASGLGILIAIKVVVIGIGFWRAPE